MKKLKPWFLNLTRIGKLSVLSSIALGGIFFASATTPPAQVKMQDASIVEDVSKEDPAVTQKTETEVVSVPFATTSREDNNLAQGVTRIETVGVNGEKTITHTITLANGIETDRTSEEKVTRYPTDEVTLIGTYVVPRYVAPAAEVSTCDQNYSGGCVPNVSYDLDCSDIGFSVNVIGYDKHRFDRDGDGFGCESY